MLSDVVKLRYVRWYAPASHMGKSCRPFFGKSVTWALLASDLTVYSVLHSVTVTDT
jgi:hypothetical protein